MKVTMDYTAAAERLEQAWRTRELIQPLSRSAGMSTIDDAYAVQSAWNTLREANGERLLGRKIGLTSKAMQEQAGFDRPDFGRLWASRYVAADDGQAEIDTSLFLQPRIEGEIAFLLKAPLRGEVSIEEVLAATEAVAPSFEIVDSRFERRDFQVIDTIADNASFGAFTIGQWGQGLLRGDLRDVPMTMERNGEVVVTGTGADSLGHPASAVAWLAATLGSYGESLQAGDWILSGSLGRAIPVSRGDEFRLLIGEEQALELTFT